VTLATPDAHVIGSLKHDQGSARHKGFAFCEYPDAATANRALQQLNGFEVFGRRLKLG
jgi:RNA recognition motif-containing protein